MRFIHPRRYLRALVRLIDNTTFLIRCRLHRVECEIGSCSHLKHCSVSSKHDGVLIIGSGCTLRGVTFRFYENGGRIELKDGIRINAYQESKTVLSVKNRSSILIGNNCLLSNPIDITTTDWHRIVDENGATVNPEKDVHIGKHVWIGSKVIICKGVSIPDNSIIGAGSVVTKSFDEPNVVIAGNPAVIKKRGVNWR